MFVVEFQWWGYLHPFMYICCCTKLYFLMLILLGVLTDLCFHMIFGGRERECSYVAGFVCWDQSWGNL